MAKKQLQLKLKFKGPKVKMFKCPNCKEEMAAYSDKEVCIQCINRALHKDYSEILTEAAQIAQERQAQYGSAVNSVQLACNILKSSFGIELNVEQFCQVMQALKMSRNIFKPKRDNIIDCINYAAIGLAWRDLKDEINGKTN